MTRPAKQEPRAPDGSGGRSRASGRHGEALAAAWLAGRGHRIEATNLRTRLGEIDVLARRGRTWIAVEVKTRRHHPAPERCVDPAQHARLVAALRALAPVLRPRPRALRVDVIAVRLGDTGNPEVTHLPGTPFPP